MLQYVQPSTSTSPPSRLPPQMSHNAASSAAASLRAARPADRVMLPDRLRTGLEAIAVLITFPRTHVGDGRGGGSAPSGSEPQAALPRNPGLSRRRTDIRCFPARSDPTLALAQDLRNTPI